MANNKTSKQIGNVTEIQNMLGLMQLGYTVSKPYGDCDKYDFICDINGKLYKLQSKTASTTDGSYFKINCRTSTRKKGKNIHQKYTKKDIDFFITNFNGIIYMIPVEDCGSDKRLRLAPTKNQQENNVTYAKQYELKEVLKRL